MRVWLWLVARLESRHARVVRAYNASHSAHGAVTTRKAPSDVTQERANNDDT